MKYILMHRELPVAVLSINDTSGTVYRVEDVVQPGQPFRLSPCAGGPADPEKTTTIRQYLDDEVFCTKSVRSILAQSCRAALGMAQGQLLP